MNYSNWRIRLAAIAGIILAATGCSSSDPAWSARNQAVVDEHKITGRTRKLPKVSVPLALKDGEPVVAADLPKVTLAPGVDAQLAWGRGALLERVTMQAGSTYPSQMLGE